MTSYTTTHTAHSHCARCDDAAQQATATARATGSTEASHTHGNHAAHVKKVS